MAHFYLVLDSDNRVVGCRTSPKQGDYPDQVEVDAEVYNQFQQLSPYERMTITDGEVTVHPDDRPAVAITVSPGPHMVGQAVTLTLQADVDLLEVNYRNPDGNQRLMLAQFEDGVATVSFIPATSGHYVLSGGDTWRPAQEIIIPVYEG